MMNGYTKTFLYFSFQIALVFWGVHATAIGASLDCNGNALDDSDASENDCNGNGVPDECDIVPQTGFTPTDLIGANVSDMNLDGRRDNIDILTDRFNLPVALRLTLNTSDGTPVVSLFDPCTSITGQNFPTFLGAKDATDDGLPDVFVLCYQPFIQGPPVQSLVMMKNLGGGNLEAPMLLYAGIAYSVDSVGDVNNDGAPDVLGTSRGIDPNTDQSALRAVILINDGTNHLAPLIFQTSEPSQISFGDLNADGASDILTQGGTIYWNDGAGSYSSANLTELGTRTGYSILDVDGDGKLDIVAAAFQAFDVYYSGGDKTFQKFSVSNLENNPNFVDYNGDGKIDVATYDDHFGDYTKARQANVYLQSTRGTFTRTYYFKNFEGSLGQDVNGDGNADQYTTSVFIQSQSAFSADENSNTVPDECEPNLRHSVLHSLWNTNLGMTNVVEIRNTADTPGTVTLVARSGIGSTVGTVTFDLSAHQERDILLNDFISAPPNSFGTLDLTQSGGEIRGGVSLYHLEGSSPASFATNIPFVGKSTGMTAGIFNNIYPVVLGNSPTSSSGSVYNWLTLANLSHSEQRFHVVETGQSVTVPAGGRVDLQLPIRYAPPPGIAASTVRVYPFGSGGSYIAHLSRFGFAATANGTRANFLNSHYLGKPTGRNLYVPIESRIGALNYLEVHSASSNLTAVEVRAFDHSGVQRFSRADLISGLLHYTADSLIGANENGYAVISSLSGQAPLVAQAVTYDIDARSTLASASDSKTARAYFPRLSSSGYNLFLGMRNYLKVVNPTMTDLFGSHTVGTLAPAIFGVEAGRTGEYELVSPVLTNTYGLVEFDTNAVPGVFGNIQRSQTGAGGTVNFSANIPLE